MKNKNIIVISIPFMFLEIQHAIVFVVSPFTVAGVYGRDGEETNRMPLPAGLAQYSSRQNQWKYST